MSDVRFQIQRALRGVQIPENIPVIDHIESKDVVSTETRSTSTPSPTHREIVLPTIEPPSTACQVCGAEVLETDNQSRGGTCGHKYHTMCLVPLIRSGRQFCSGCIAPATAYDHAKLVGGYSVDTGNDTDVRATVLAALEYQREKVRLHSQRRWKRGDE